MRADRERWRFEREMVEAEYRLKRNAMLRWQVPRLAVGFVGLFAIALSAGVVDPRLALAASLALLWWFRR